jgi:hypothetical protein
MTWQEKVAALRVMDPTIPALAMFFQAPRPAADENIRQLLSSLVETAGLEEFLRTCDGLVTGVTYLGGADQHGFPNIADMEYRYSESRPTTHTAVGETGGGEAILLAPGGRVEFLWSRDQSRRIIASSLAEFIDQVLLGPRYGLVSGRSEWIDLIESQGWLR